MFRIKFLTALLCLAACCALYANDVALVTEKTGTVDAQLADETWAVELAEMLPDGVELKVSEDGSLTLVHLQSNIEYRLEANATATLTNAGVTGSNFSSSTIELVSSKIALGQEMQTQTGTTNPERVLNRSLKPSKMPPEATSAGADALRPIPKMAKHKEVMEDSLKNEISMDKSAFDGETGALSEIAVSADQQDLIVPETGEESAAVEAPKALAAPSITLALPTEIFAEICSDETSLVATGTDVTASKLAFALEGWVEVEVAFGKDIGKSVVLQGNVGSMTFDIAEVAAPSIAEAWKLEKRGFVHQAAAMWLKLPETSISQKKSAIHLNRLKAAITALAK
ncbi:MAG: hypothetical protein EOM80_12080 [Erysipelotrichia bacterium]|nr:hypothetical protein [Erysipelotrichia bacterium]